MKTAKQINDEQTGQIVPMVIETPQKHLEIRVHPDTCRKCSEPINKKLCHSCFYESFIDDAVRDWLDFIFPSFDHFKYHGPSIKFSDYIKTWSK